MSETVLKRFALFADLGEQEREELEDLLECRALSEGETLFHEGDEGDALVLVTEGALELVSRRTGERGSVPAGTAVGGLALFGVGSREVSAIGAERAEVMLLRREDYCRFAEDHPRGALRIAEALLAELATAARYSVRALSNGAGGSVDPPRVAE